MFQEFHDGLLRVIVVLNDYAFYLTPLKSLWKDVKKRLLLNTHPRKFCGLLFRLIHVLLYLPILLVRGYMDCSKKCKLYLFWDRSIHIDLCDTLFPFRYKVGLLVHLRHKKLWVVHVRILWIFARRPLNLLGGWIARVRVHQHHFHTGLPNT